MNAARIPLQRCAALLGWQSLTRKQIRTAYWLLAAVAASTILALLFQDPLLDFIHASIHEIRGLQSRNPVMFALLYATVYTISLTLLLPVDALMTAVAGIAYHPVVGTLFACTLHTLGTLGGFIGAQRLLDSKTPEEPLCKPLKAWLSLVVLRVIPFLPTHLATLALARSPLGLAGFATATWVGSLPLTAAVVWASHKLGG